MLEPYTDFEVRIRAGNPDTKVYPVEVTLKVNNKDIHFNGETLPFDERARENLQVLYTDPQAYGEELFYLLFNGAIRRAYDAAWGYAEANTHGRLRVRLRIDDKAAELHAHIWERLYHASLSQGEGLPVAISANMPFSRFIALSKLAPDPIIERPIRMLFTISNPRNLSDFGLAALDIRQEILSLRDALRYLQRGEQIHVTLLTSQADVLDTRPGEGTDCLRVQLEREGYEICEEMASLKNIVRRLNLGEGHHILHFLGHGSYKRWIGQGPGAAVLFLEDEEGLAEPVRDSDIVDRLQSSDQLPHLVFLSACESAKRTSEDENPFVGLAPKLVSAGVPAVVAMQDVVPMLTARQLTAEFYRYLVVEHGIVDQALNQARLMLYDRQGSQDWAIPVLFMRLGEGQLFAADPVQVALRAMACSDVFNPLPSEEDYLPLEVLHLSGEFGDFSGLGAADLRSVVSVPALARERIPPRDTLDAVLDIFSRSGFSAQHKLVALIGEAGMGKSILLRRIGYKTAQDSLSLSAADVVVPVYIDLEARVGLDATALGNPDGSEAMVEAPMTSSETSFRGLERLMLQALQRFWDDLTMEDFRSRLEARTGLIFRVLVDGSDALPDHVRHKVWRALDDFIRKYPYHQYIVTYNETLASSSSEVQASNNTQPGIVWPLAFTDFLIIQPLSQRKIEQYLKATTALQQSPNGGLSPQRVIKRKLYGALERAQLFDIAGLPWALMTMLEQARRGEFPVSLAQVVGNLVEEMIADIAPDQGMRARAAQTLYALAWHMQSTRKSCLSIEDVFEILAVIRGNRGYNLDLFYQELLRHALLVSVGEEAVRFTRSFIQAYCCARAMLARDDLVQVLDDITATLGRRTRLRWWSKTLILLGGLMGDPEVLVRKILYGVALSEGEQVLLAARVIQECSQSEGNEGKIRSSRGPGNLESARRYVIRTLLFRLDISREPRVTRRVRIIEALGRLRSLTALPRLVEIANQKIRENDTKYEFSSVRLAAVLALQRIVASPVRDGSCLSDGGHLSAVAELDPQLAKVLDLWWREQVEALVPYLLTRSEQYEGLQAIAAFALGSLQTGRAIEVVVQAFLMPGFSREAYRNVCTALTLLDPGIVTKYVILPLLDPRAAEAQGLSPAIWEDREQWYEHLAYLIGRIRTSSEQAYVFLHRCLYESSDVQLKSLAIQSMGWLYDRDSKWLLERIALGKFSTTSCFCHLRGNPSDFWLETFIVADLAPDLHIPDDLSPIERLDLQRRALEALSYIGDNETLEQLATRPPDWDVELEQAFYWTTEEILARLSEGYL